VIQAETTGATSAAKARRAILLRIAVPAVLAILAGASIGATAKPVAASGPDCSYYSCATLIVSVTGTGYAHIVDDQGGDIDFYYNAGSTYGVTSYQYYWIGPNPLVVNVKITPNADSWLCGGLCTGLGEYQVPLETLYPGTTVTLTGYVVNIANTLSLTESPSGDGSGRIVSTPSGLDCKIVAGAGSGTCSHTWSYGRTFYVTVTASPAPGVRACDNSGVCQPVGAPLVESFPQTGSGTLALHWSFRKGHPILATTVSGQGSVVSSPSAVSCPSTCSSYFPPGSTVTLSAKAKSGWVFSHWSGACAAFSAICNLTVGTADVSTTAVFASTATPRPPSPAATPRPTALPIPSPVAAPTTSVVPEGSAGPSGEIPVPVAAAISSPQPTAAGAGDTGAAQPSGFGVDAGLFAIIGLLVLLLGVAVGVAVTAVARRRRTRNASG
jgi:hypothetical protein